MLASHVQHLKTPTVLRGMLVAIAAIGGLAQPVIAQHSVAREWNEELLDAIRNDLARPTIHARNLYHVSAAMWDGWTAYAGPGPVPIFHSESATAVDIQAARDETISYAAYRLLKSRFANSVGAATSLPSFDARMVALGYDMNFTDTIMNTPASLGNRIAETIISFGLTDGANEANDYINQFYQPTNPPLLPALPGNPDIVDVNRWQPLALQFFVDQAGNVILGGYPEFLGPEWGQVTPFSLSSNDLTIYNRDSFDYWVYHDPGPPPFFGGVDDDYYRWGFEMVAVWSSHLDPSDGVMWDISPASIGNAPLPNAGDYEQFYDFENGGDWGTGYTVNPVTGQPYTPQLVPRADYARILAEFWADGPDSETPPGHWFTLANYVSDHPLTKKRIGGQGVVIDDLEWDVKLYLALGGAMHDVAISAWGVKGWYDYIRPVSAIRYLADQGQCTDPLLPSFDPNGIHLQPGYIEVITSATTASGGQHEHLVGLEGKIALNAWRGPDYIANPASDEAGVGWILAENWWPYQRPSFVTPPFAGYVSGHSTYSRAAAIIMTNFTGSEYFPGGLGEFQAPQNQFLVFEDGPSMNVTLQWAKYNDASDQCSLSRIWGGIHPPADDLPGRIMGQQMGEDAYAFAQSIFGSVCGNGVPEDGEECDDGVANSDTTPDACRIDCTNPICGDDVQDSGEECDNGAGNANAPNLCRTSCQLPTCLDGIVDNGEQCDDGVESANCDDDCTPAVCGDGVANQAAGEACDDAGASTTCDLDCTAAVCGDGTLNLVSGEECDDGNTNDDDGCSAICTLDGAAPIPAVSGWGMMLLLAGLATGIMIRFGGLARVSVRVESDAHNQR